MASASCAPTLTGCAWCHSGRSGRTRRCSCPGRWGRLIRVESVNRLTDCYVSRMQAEVDPEDGRLDEGGERGAGRHHEEDHNKVRTKEVTFVCLRFFGKGGEELISFCH